MGGGPSCFRASPRETGPTHTREAGAAVSSVGSRGHCSLRREPETHQAHSFSPPAAPPHQFPDQMLSLPRPYSSFNSNWSTHPQMEQMVTGGR